MGNFVQTLLSWNPQSQSFPNISSSSPQMPTLPCFCSQSSCQVFVTFYRHSSIIKSIFRLVKYKILSTVSSLLDLFRMEILPSSTKIITNIITNRFRTRINSRIISTRIININPKLINIKTPSIKTRTISSRIINIRTSQISSIRILSQIRIMVVVDREFNDSYRFHLSIAIHNSLSSSLFLTLFYLWSHPE